MKKKPPPTLPPLSLEALQQINKVEDYARIALMTSTKREQVRRIVGTSVISIFNIHFGFYAFLPDFQQDWIREIRDQSIDSIIEMCPVFAPGEKFRPELHRIVQEHMHRVLVSVRAEKAKRDALRGINQPTTNSAATKPVSPRDLKNSYLSKFTEKIKILDICWAARQRYSEWKRWLRGAIKDGSTPDRAFRAILSSGKSPSEYRKERRPPGWK